MTDPIAPGATIGILGGGQLGRLLALAAAHLGFDVAVYTDELDAPASRVAAWSRVGAWEDLAAIADFARQCAIVTYETENIPLAAAEAVVAAGAPLRPGLRSLSISQDRLPEKQFLRSIGIATADFVPVEDPETLERALASLGAPAILKTRRMGYDGKGQVLIRHPRDACAAFARLSAGGPLILEAFVPFAREVSALAARNPLGAAGAFDVTENRHENHVLAWSRAPADISAATAQQALAWAHEVARALDHVGLLALELFVLANGALIANEIAPRVHNSGHWTMDAALHSQFDLHIRAICGWPLADAARTHDVVMQNLLGTSAADWRAHAIDPSVRLHLYGKRDAREGRKMGHLNRLGRPAY